VNVTSRKEICMLRERGTETPWLGKDKAPPLRGGEKSPLGKLKRKKGERGSFQARGEDSLIQEELTLGEYTSMNSI